VPVVTLAGPGIAAEIVAGSPTALVCASRDAAARRLVARTLTAPNMFTVTTSDVAGVETASAFKNAVAIVVGIGQAHHRQHRRGVANTAVALKLAARYSIDLPTARVVDLALREELTDARAADQLRQLFEAAMRPHPWPN
jgi:glycerol-3-phosphate dehydrogenase